MKVSQWLKQAQTGETSRQRALAVEALGKNLGLAEVQVELIPPIGSALTTDPSPAVRTQAAVVLAGMRAEDKKMLAPYLSCGTQIGEGIACAQGNHPRDGEVSG